MVFYGDDRVLRIRFNNKRRCPEYPCSVTVGPGAIKFHQVTEKEKEALHLCGAFVRE